MTKRILLILIAFLTFPIATRTAFIETELTYDCMNAQGMYSFVPYLGGLGQINLVNGNIVFSRPLPTRPGRAGLNLSLSLAYNSKIWTRTGTTLMGLSELGSSVGLGWRLGFPYLVQGRSSYTLVMSDGSSHEIADYGRGDWRSVDSTYIRLTPGNPNVATMVGGTKLFFGNTVGANSYATEVRDRNGNQIFATYVPGTGKLASIDDSLGNSYDTTTYPYTAVPQMTFFYGGDGFLSSIRVMHASYPIWINFQYATPSLSPSFPSPYTVQSPGPNEKVLSSIWMAGINGGGLSNTRLGQVFQYNQFGELAVVTDSVSEYGYDYNTYQWTLISTSSRDRVAYSYGTNSIYDGGTPNWRPQRMVSQKTEYVNNNGTTTSTTWSISYSVDQTKSNPSSVEVAADIDGRTIYNLNYTSSGANWSDGMPTSVTRKTYNGQTVLRTQSYSWSQDDTLKTFVLNPRITSATTTLDDGKTTQTATTYAADGTGNVKETVETGFSGSVLRRTAMEYWHETHPEYVAQGLTNLVSAVSTRNAGNVELTRTQTAYDEYGAYPLVAMAYNPVNHNSGYWTAYLTRGNATSAGALYKEQSRWIMSHAQYDIAGNVVRKVDPKGSQSTISYTVGPYPASSTDALNHTTQYQWESFLGTAWTGNLYSTTDPNGAQVTNAYDGLNRKVNQSAPTGNSYFSYDDQDYQVTTNNSSGYSYFDSNPSGNTIKTQKEIPSENSIYEKADYDAHGRATKKWLPSRGGTAAFTTYSYDVLGRITSISPATGGQITYQYVGNVTTATDQEGRRKRTEHNESGQILKVIEEDSNGNWGPETVYSYDIPGRLIQILQGVQVRTYGYNSLGRKIAETNPESGTVTFVYDDNGNVTQKTDARGVVTGYSYDALNRLLVTSYSDGTPWSLMSYDESSSSLIGLITNGQGRMTSAWTVNSSLQITGESVGYSWSYDQGGRVTQQIMRMDSTNYPVNYSYTPAGCGCSKKDLQSMTYPDGNEITYTRDPIGRATGIVDTVISGTSRTYVTDVDYALVDGSVSLISYGTSSEEHVTDSYGRLSIIRITVPNSMWGTPHEYDLNYSYTLSNRISRVDYTKKDAYGNSLESKWSTYGYDRLGRLSAETLQSANGTEWSSNWSYDRYGNVSGTANDQNNRLAAYASYYDQSGNQLQDAANSYLYNANSLIRQVNRTSDSALLGAYRYDALGRRVKKSWNYYYYGEQRSVSYSYVYGNGNEILAEYKVESASWQTYENTYTNNIYMNSALVARRTRGYTNNSFGYTVVDNLKWPGRNHRQEEVVTIGSQIVDSGFYSRAFGSGGSDQYPGHKVDEETGLKDFGARYYNTSLMRWTSPDPLTAHIYDPQSLNKYAYVRNDPLNRVDADGKFWNPLGWLGSSEYNPPVDFSDFMARSALYWYAFAYSMQPPQPVIQIPAIPADPVKTLVDSGESIAKSWVSDISSDCGSFVMGLFNSIYKYQGEYYANQRFSDFQQFDYNIVSHPNQFHHKWQENATATANLDTWTIDLWKPAFDPAVFLSVEMGATVLHEGIHIGLNSGDIAIASVLGWVSNPQKSLDENTLDASGYWDDKLREHCHGTNLN